MNRFLSPRWLLVILSGLNLFNYLDRYIVSAVLPYVKAEFQLDDASLGRINTSFMLGYFFTSPLFGYLGDRASRKWLIAAGIFVWSIGTVTTGLATAFGMLLLFRVLVGVGEASYATISPSLISDTFPTERRNNALTIFYAAIPVGAALGNIIGGTVAAEAGWRHAFIWAGAPGLLLALVLLPFRDPERESSRGTAAEKPRLGDLFHLFRLRDYQLVVWGYTAYTFALGAFAVWGPTFLERVHHVPVKTAARFFGVVLVVAGLIGTLVGGTIATAWRRRNAAGYAWVLGLSVLLAVPAATAAFLTPDRTLSMIFLAAAMFFIFLGTGPVNTLILETVPANLRASAMAISIFMIHLFGDMWSSELVGALSDHWHNLQKAVLILPAALLIGGVLWLLLAALTHRAVEPRATPAA